MCSSLIFAIPATANANNKMQQSVAGTVLDANGQPLPGASVVEKGTNNGTQTDFEGNYAIEVGDDAILVVSYFGYKTQEVSVSGQTQIDVTLEEDVSQLNEVVVVGYGSQRKSDLTGSISSVDSKSFEKQPLTKIDQALQGRAAGVQVNQTSGAPGSAFKIRVRGTNSIAGNNEPLYVVDGVVVGNINSLNVNDIKSMEVLKDASSTAIYGSRGANGVVLITTKTGRVGPAKIQFETFYSVSNVIQELDMMTPAEFAEGVNFAEGSEFYSPADIEALRNGGGEDWQERLFRTANAFNAQLSISGGSDKVDYFISGNYLDSEGTIIDQDYKRYTLRTNLNVDLNDKMKIGLNSFLSREESHGYRANLATGLTWDPTTPAFDENGDYNFVPLISGVGNGTINPLVIPENNIRDNYNNQLVLSGYYNYNINDNFELNIAGGLDRSNRNNNWYEPSLVNGLGRGEVEHFNVTRLQNTNRLTYTWDSNPDHKLKIDAVHEQQKVVRERTTARGEDFFSDQTGYKDLSIASIQTTTNNSNNENLQSVLGRVNYSLFDKFLFTASVRGDGSSKFREGNQWGVFPSGSVAWKLSNEQFIQNVETISNLKLRASYGIIGSQAVDPLATRSLPITGDNVNYPFTGAGLSVGLAPSNRLANPDLTWETTRQFNFGVDLGLWDSKVTLSLDIYKKNTEDLLLDRIIPEFVGPTVQTVNAGEVENKGFDLTIGWNAVRTDDWNVSSNLTLSSNKNKVVSLIDGVDFMELGNVYYTNTFPVNPTRVEVGLPISSFRGYVFEGVYQLGEEDEAAAFGRVPGDAKYKDVNGDGTISSEDIATIGDGNPDVTWGWNWDVNYKQFNLNFVLLGSHGNDIYNFQRGRMMGLGAAQFHAVHADYNNRWTPENPSNIPANRDTTELLSSQFLEDGSYVTLKNVSFSYNFEEDVLSKIGFDSARVFVNAENLFVITDYSGFDPESTASGQSDVDLGIDLNAYPINRTFSFGVALGF